MAELAAGAVSSLLVVIRNEAVLLGGVRDDVQFIKEEMESMNSFLAHLARTEPPSGEHNEQVRTWMSQVRLLAQDCNNCIGLYLYRGNPDIHRARAGLRRYIWWASWFLHKLAAQHRAAIQLRQLKDRARDVGERRLRYGVEVPAKSAEGHSPSVAAGLIPSSSPKTAAGGYAAADDEEDHEYQLIAAAATGQSGRRAFFEPPTFEYYVKMKLLEWVEEIPPDAGKTTSIAIVAPNAGKDVLALARETLLVQPSEDRAGYHRCITVDIPAVHLNFLPLRPKEVLYYILRELQHDKDQGHVEEEEEEEEEKNDWQDYMKKWDIYFERKRAFFRIKSHMKTDIDAKLDKIKRGIQARQNKGNQNQLEENPEQDMDQLGLEALFQRLHCSAASQQDGVKNKEMHKLQKDDKFITMIAKKLKEYMEEDEDVEELVGVEEVGERGGDRKEEKQGEEEKEQDGTRRRERISENYDDNEEQNKGNEKEKGGGGDRKKENDDNAGEKGGGEDAGRGECKEENERLEVEVQNDKMGKEGEGAEGTKNNKQEQEEETDEEGNEEDELEEAFHLPSLFEEGKEGKKKHSIQLYEDQYTHILREVYGKTTNSKHLHAQQQATNTTTTTLSEERIKEIIHETKQEILKELQEGKLDKNKPLSEHVGVQGKNQKDDFEAIEQKIDKIKLMFKEQLKIKGLLDEIKHHLKWDCPLIILKVDDMMDGSIWEETRKALSLLQCSADALIFTTVEDIQQAKGYCHPSREPIDYSVGLYHHTVLELIRKQNNKDNYDPQVFRDILEECEPHEFCMKIFTHALHANPKRSTEELIKLHRSLRASQKSFNIIAKKMFKFSYNDLPKEYKSCLLYLAIFTKGQSIRRSTLVGRWVAEGLIFKEDWHSSVLEANRCFDALVNRWLVYPADIGATGKVKSCMVGDPVYGFITTIAKKQHIVETRLSHRFARHFSIFNDLILRSSDKIDNFFKMLSESSRLSLLKVLDLEGCQCFDGRKANERYLKEICSKMLLLKYLSLRGTYISHLPDEINNLRELEVLDIRETKVPACATVNVLLLKLKRLLAGHNNLSTSNSGISSSVQIPHKIEKMVKMEVLSNVKVQSSRDFKDIGKLWKLRKLGVVIDDKDKRLKDLVKMINDLHECLFSLSITLSMDRRGDNPSREGPSPIKLELKQPPKNLESLTIRGTSKRGHLLPLFTKDGNNTLAKVTLSSTNLNHDDLVILAKMPNLRCVKLRNIASTNDVLTFKRDGFKCLKYLLVEGSNWTNIIFEDEAASDLEMMVFSSTMVGHVSGVGMLSKLEELELNKIHSRSRLLSSFRNANQIVKLTLRGTLLEQGDLQMLAKKPNLQCLVLLDISCVSTQNKITFNKNEFPKLNLLTVHCSAITNIHFTKGSALKLKKIIWSSRTSLSGIEYLPRLKELEIHGGPICDDVKKAIEKRSNKPELKHIEPENQDQATGQGHDDDDSDDGPSRFPFCWKKHD